MQFKTLVCISLVIASVSRASAALPDSEPTDPFNNPSRHAWNLFLRLNHPAQPISQGRGLPDSTKKIGEPGTTAVWETWRLASAEVFLQPPKVPPTDFNTPPDPTMPPNGKVPEPNKPMVIAHAKAQGMRPLSNPTILFDPNDGLFNPDDPKGGFGESRMNKATYDFIVKNGLYNRAGIIAYAKDFFAGTKPPLSFPVDSIEVKAAWVKFKASDVAAGKDKRFYVTEYKGDKYGLTSLHIITKDIPNWFWCTFHHKEIPIGVGTPDTYGQPKELRGTVWENYKLGGTQTDFVSSTGQPTLLSDAYIEYGFTSSSCISCHAGAAVNAAGLPVLGSNPDSIGVPNPQDYWKDGKPVLMQLDFLFSVAFRAR
jgi:hypothetical protein